jgi:hypothetical protein
LQEKKEKNGLDYYIARAMKDTFPARMLDQPSVTDFGGYSGGGLFLLLDGNDVRLVGIAYYQNRESLEQDGYVEVYFYGPRSIEQFLEECTLGKK